MIISYMVCCMDASLDGGMSLIILANFWGHCDLDL